MTRLAAASLFCLMVPPLVAGAQSSRGTGTTRADEFSAVRCGHDVPAALIGKAVRKGRVVAIEAAHRDIGLQNTGGSEVNDSLFLGGWVMCGAEYQLLESPRRVRDAIRFPPHSRRQPAFFGTCTVNGKKLPDAVLAVLDNPEPRGPAEPPYAPEDPTPLAAIAAWRVDEARARLVKIPTQGLRCPRGQIFTVDGGT